MKNLRSLAIAAFATVALSSFASADLFTYTVPAGGIVTDAEYGEAGNFLTSLNLGAGAVITGIGWDVTITANNPSWRSEASFAITDNDNDDTGVFVGPGFVDDSPGGPTAYSSGGILDLSDNGIPDITLADGAASLQFYESFNDGGVVDGLYAAGSTITVQYTPGVVPEPATLAALGVGAAALLRRRKAKRA